MKWNWNDEAALRRDVEQSPDAYQYERAQRFGVSPRGMCSALQRLNISRKKSLEHPKANEEERAVFQEKISAYKAAGIPIVYLDESGFAHAMPRGYGDAPIGERCIGSHDWHAKGRVNVIGAMLGDALLTACLFEGNINSDVFHAWVTPDLLPKVRQDTVIVMDNATFHQRADTQDAIARAGCILEYLPAYSPDLNPIEHQWAQAKALRRKHRCDVHTLFSDHLNYINLIPIPFQNDMIRGWRTRRLALPRVLFRRLVHPRSMSF